MTSDEETTNMEVVDLEKLCNFVVDNFFIWIHLVPQTINLHSVCYNMWGRKTQYRHKWERGGVVEEVARERGHEFEYHRPRSVRILRKKCRDLWLVTCNFNGDGRALAGGCVPPSIK